MNFCSIEEAYGDPYENFGRRETFEPHVPDVNDCYDMESLDSYSICPSREDAPYIQSPCQKARKKIMPEKKEKVKKVKKDPMRNCPQFLRRNDDTMYAVMYIVSGMYVIFILDVFVRMGAKL